MFYRILFKRVNKIIVQTNQNRLYLNKNFQDCSVEVIPNLIIYPIPITGRILDPVSVVQKHKKIILAAGRLHKFKQFDVLIDSFSLIKDKYKDWDLVILGDGEERRSLTNQIINLKMDKRIHLPGIVGNVSSWYDRADLFVLSSLVEGFPNVLLEAMSYGLPCVSFDCDTGPRELINNGINGILVNPNEKEFGLSKAISSILNDEKLRNDISGNALLTRNNNSIKKIIHKWNKAINL